MVMNIHITRNGEQHGPYPEATARQMLEAGQLLPADLAWHDGAEGWKPLSEVLGAAAQPPATPPSPPAGGILKRTMAGAAPAEGKTEDSEGGDPDQIRVTRKGEPIGPYSREKAKEYFASGQLLSTDWGWHDGMDDWKPLNEVLGMAAPAQTTAATGQLGNSKYSKTIKIAKLQKRIMWVLLAGFIINLLAKGASIALQQAMQSGESLGTVLAGLGVNLVILFALIAILILQIVTLVQLRNSIGAGVAGTVFCCLFQCVPLVNLIVLALASQKATEILKGQGCTVGFMGMSGVALKELEARS
jgi:hypothetical protein